MSASFDTLSYARRMEAVGFTRAQAEALAEEQAKLIDERLATKADIGQVQIEIEGIRASLARDVEQLRQETKAGIEQLRQETRTGNELLRRDMEILRRDLTVRLGGIVIASVAAASTFLAVFSRLHP